MIDLRFLRENPEVVKENIRKKFQEHKLPLVDEVIELDEQARKAQQEADAIRASRNKLSKEIGQLMAQGKKEEAEAVKAQVAANAARLAELEVLEKELGDKVKICKMNVDEAPNTAASYEIRSIPTMFLFKDGEKIDAKVGFNSQPAIEEWLKSYL